jgi:hypothetical protein
MSKLLDKKESNKKESNKKGQENKKNSQLIIRIKKEERDAFVELCDELDTSAAREIRLFIREFLSKHKK